MWIAWVCSVSGLLVLSSADLIDRSTTARPNANSFCQYQFADNEAHGATGEST
jgi:hypothetical protein